MDLHLRRKLIETMANCSRTLHVLEATVNEAIDSLNEHVEALELSGESPLITPEDDAQPRDVADEHMMRADRRAMEDTYLIRGTTDEIKVGRGSRRRGRGYFLQARWPTADEHIMGADLRAMEDTSLLRGTTDEIKVGRGSCRGRGKYLQARWPTADEHIMGADLRAMEDTSHLRGTTDEIKVGRGSCRGSRKGGFRPWWVITDEQLMGADHLSHHFGKLGGGGGAVTPNFIKN